MAKTCFLQAHAFSSWQNHHSQGRNRGIEKHGLKPGLWCLFRPEFTDPSRALFADWTHSAGRGRC